MSALPARIERMLALPAWWRGAANARAEIYASDETLQNGRGIVRAQTIELKCAAGCPLTEIPEFTEWLRAP